MKVRYSEIIWLGILALAVLAIDAVDATSARPGDGFSGDSFGGSSFVVNDPCPARDFPALESVVPLVPGNFDFEALESIRIKCNLDTLGVGKVKGTATTVLRLLDSATSAFQVIDIDTSKIKTAANGFGGIDLEVPIGSLPNGFTGSATVSASVHSVVALTNGKKLTAVSYNCITD